MRSLELSYGESRLSYMLDDPCSEHAEIHEKLDFVAFHEAEVRFNGDSKINTKFSTSSNDELQYRNGILYT
jgi:hypothetical protein